MLGDVLHHVTGQADNVVRERHCVLFCETMFLHLSSRGVRNRAHISGLLIGAVMFSVHLLSAAYDVSNILIT